MLTGSEVPGWNHNYYLTIVAAPTEPAAAPGASANATSGAATTSAKWELLAKPIESSYEEWWNFMGILRPQDVPRTYKLVFIPRLYEPTIIWLITGLVFMAVRFRGVFRPAFAESRVAIPMNDRTTMRLLGLPCSGASLRRSGKSV